MGRALRPIPQKLFFLVGWAEEPVLIIFARGLIQNPKSKIQNLKSKID
jgi:hypothetical protein